MASLGFCVSRVTSEKKKTDCPSGQEPQSPQCCFIGQRRSNNLSRWWNRPCEGHGGDILIGARVTMWWCGEPFPRIPGILIGCAICIFSPLSLALVLIWNKTHGLRNVPLHYHPRYSKLIPNQQQTIGELTNKDRMCLPKAILDPLYRAKAIWSRWMVLPLHWVYGVWWSSLLGNASSLLVMVPFCFNVRERFPRVSQSLLNIKGPYT